MKIKQRSVSKTSSISRLNPSPFISYLHLNLISKLNNRKEKALTSDLNGLNGIKWYFENILSIKYFLDQWLNNKFDSLANLIRFDFLANSNEYSPNYCINKKSVINN